MDDLGRLGTVLGWTVVIFAFTYFTAHWMGIIPVDLIGAVR